MSISTATYSEYKDSGVEWVNSIPSDWTHDKIVSLFNFPNDKVSDVDFEPLSVTYGGVKKQVEDAAKTDNGSNRKLLKVGDIAFNGRSDRKGACGMSVYEGSISVVYHVLRKRSSEVHVPYFHHLFRNTLFSQEFYRWGRGIHDDMWTTRVLEMKRIQVPLPPLETQKRIAAFLDEKTKTIDFLIEKKEKLVELLREKRESLVANVVTSGLDPKVKMKPSGVDWLGRVPDHWKLMPARAILNERREKNTRLITGNILSVMRNVGVIRYADKGNVGNKSSDRPENYKIVYPNDLVLNSMNLVIGSVGISRELGVTSSVYIIYSTTKDAVPDYYHNVFMVRGFQKHLGTYGRGIMELRESVKHDDIKIQPIPVPPKSEQTEIAKYLADHTKGIDKTISLVLHEIEKLNELRSSMIFSAVTGKIKI